MEQGKDMPLGDKVEFVDKTCNYDSRGHICNGIKGKNIKKIKFVHGDQFGALLD